MSASASAKIVVAVPFETIGRVYDEPRKFTKYHQFTGKEIEIQGIQSVVEIAGKKIPDLPFGDPVRNWKKKGWHDEPEIDKGTDPVTNLYWYLTGNDKRWEGQTYINNILTGHDAIINLKMIGLVAQSTSDHGWRENPLVELNMDAVVECKNILLELLLKLGFQFGLDVKYPIPDFKTYLIANLY